MEQPPVESSPPTLSYESPPAKPKATPGMRLKMLLAALALVVLGGIVAPYIVIHTHNDLDEISPLLMCSLPVIGLTLAVALVAAFNRRYGNPDDS